MSQKAGIQMGDSKLINDLEVMLPSTIFEDFRGEYIALFDKSIVDYGIDFVQDTISISYPGVLRGIHGDYKTWKLVTCLKGAFYLVVVDNRPDSSTYKNVYTTTLSSVNKRQVLIPPGCGNGHYVLGTEAAIFHYKQSSAYDRASQFTIRWNDPAWGVSWPCKDPILSARDSVG